MKNLMRHITLLVVFAATPLTTVRAQDSLPVTVGDTIRITAPTLDLDKYDGTVRSMDGDTLTVDTLRIAVASVTSLDVHRGRKGNVGRGAIIGTVVGVATGLALGVFYQQLCSNNSDIGETCFGLIPLGAAAVGLAGALVGGTVGALIKTDRWEQVPLDRLRVSFAPQRDGRFTFGLSVAF